MQAFYYANVCLHSRKGMLRHNYKLGGFSQVAQHRRLRMSTNPKVATGDVHYFDGGDIDLLVKTMELVPDLEMVAFIGKLARRVGLKYPIVNHDDLLPLF